MEEKPDQVGGLFQQALARNQGAIAERRADPKVGFLPTDMRHKYACQQALQGDVPLQQALSEKTHRTALFVLQLSVQEDKTRTADGCRETRRSFVAPRDIVHIILPAIHERVIRSHSLLQREVDKGRICFVGDAEAPPFPFCGTAVNGVSVPNYNKAVEDLLKESEGQVIFTHMTRLPEAPLTEPAVVGKVSSNQEE